ncbi:right-handed parallel beta-helix repeat-containing protein [Thermodesulfobacteriota bacterium]
MHRSVLFCLAFALVCCPGLLQGATIRVPAEQSTIQAAIELAVDWDLVLVAPGTYDETVDFLGKAIIVRAEEGPVGTIIDGGEGASVVTFANGETLGSVIEGFTITKGSGTPDPYGPTTFGGGIYCLEASPKIIGCVIAGNRAEVGGGIFCESASPSIRRCRISNNDADFGGGIFCQLQASPLIVNCVIDGNEAVDAGGGIGCHMWSDATIVHSTITGNRASAETLGGAGLFVFFSEVSLTNAIVWGNRGPDRKQIRIGFYDMNSTLTVSHSVVQDGMDGVFVYAQSTLEWLCGNLNRPPIFVGGGDYRLTPFSPCIDAGTHAGVTEDFDGFPRPLGDGFDIGAHEFTLGGICFLASALSITRPPIVVPMIVIPAKAGIQ